MSRCESIEKLLLAGEPLNQDDRAHLNSCATCQQTAALLKSLVQAGKQIAMADEVKQEVVTEVSQVVMAKIEPRPLRRWPLAASALTVGILGLVVLLVAIGRQPQAVTETGENFLAFMDEVVFDQSEYDVDGGTEFLESDLFGTAALAFEEQDDWTLSLPDSYQALEDILEI